MDYLQAIVLGIVLEPEVVDAQGDIYTAEEIRAAAHRFMEDFGLPFEGTEDVESAQTSTGFFPLPPTHIELVHPLRGQGPMHLMLVECTDGLAMRAVARFRDPDGPRVLLCTEVGGEGRGLDPGRHERGGRRRDPRHLPRARRARDLRRGQDLLLAHDARSCC